MAYVIFAVCTIAAGAIASLVDVEAGTSHGSQPDYHFVPFAGDVFGA